MMPGTSPSITGLANGGYEVAFQANTGYLYTIGSDMHGSWGLGMMPGTSLKHHGPCERRLRGRLPGQHRLSVQRTGFDVHGSWGLGMMRPPRLRRLRPPRHQRR